MTGCTLLPGVLARETTVEPHSESAGEADIFDFKKRAGQ